jgi:preprotein translocase subunit SecA
LTIPTNRPLIRTNYADCVYKTEKEKFNAAVAEIAELYNLGRPVLVGTISIDKSERLSELLKRRGVPHQILNAKYHEMEAQIIAQAGRYKAVTIATNMAGRGTDILLGGNPEYMAKNLARQKLKPDDPSYQEEYKKLLEQYRKETDAEHRKVVELGGLHVLGTERHEARRIDNQLRGRSGRQGDPGSSRFYVSLGDDLMRLFGSDRLVGIMDKLGLEEGQVIEHPWISKSIEIAQRRVEQYNFEIRKQLLEYDNVMNKQREVIYGQRRSVLEGAFLKEDILSIIDKIIGEITAIHTGDKQSYEEWDIAGLASTLRLKFDIEIDAFKIQKLNRDELKEELCKDMTKGYEEKERLVGSDMMRHLERMVFLQIIDSKWKDHLYAMDTLREGIGLRAYGQRDPLVEYKREAFEMFSQMITVIEEEATETIFRIQAVKPERFRGVFSSVSQELLHPEASMPERPQANAITEEMPRESPKVMKPSPQISGPKVGRNDPCPCGSKKKYKKCCGR